MLWELFQHENPQVSLCLEPHNDVLLLPIFSSIPRHYETRLTRPHLISTTHCRVLTHSKDDGCCPRRSCHTLCFCLALSLVCFFRLAALAIYISRSFCSCFYHIQSGPQNNRSLHFSNSNTLQAIFLKTCNWVPWALIQLNILQLQSKYLILSRFHVTCRPIGRSESFEVHILI